MADSVDGGRQRGSRWRIVPWAIAALLLLLPLVAMQFTDEVVWDETDFLVMGAMLLGACGVFELAARTTGNNAYRAAVGVAVVAAVLLVWINLAAGIIGREDDSANLMYFAPLAVGIVGAFIARFQPHGMARALGATALAHAAVAVMASIAEMQHASYSSVSELVGLNGFFVALFLGSAWLFQKAPAGANSRGRDGPTEHADGPVPRDDEH
jgi:hypothetical protein